MAIPHINNDVLSEILSNFSLIELVPFTSVSRQWHMVIHRIRSRKPREILVREERMEKLRSEKKRLKVELCALYSRQTDYKYHNPKYYRYAVCEFMNEFNRFFGPVEGYVDVASTINGINVTWLVIAYNHSCGRYDMNDGDHCWCPIRDATLDFLAPIGRELGHWNQMVGFTSKFTQDHGWSGIDPSLTLSDFKGKSHVVITRQFMRSVSHTHVIEHVFQRVISHRIVWRKFMQDTSAQVEINTRYRADDGLARMFGPQIVVQPFGPPNNGPGGFLVVAGGNHPVMPVD